MTDRAVTGEEIFRRVDPFLQAESARTKIAAVLVELARERAASRDFAVQCEERRPRSMEIAKQINADLGLGVRDGLISQALIDCCGHRRASGAFRPP